MRIRPLTVGVGPSVAAMYVMSGGSSSVMWTSLASTSAVRRFAISVYTAISVSVEATM
ncbi:MAG: hypothetical protein U0470_07755 [Anaerolineae bacterium]